MLRAHQIAHAIVGVKQIAVDLRSLDRRGEKRERHRRIVAALDGERARRATCGSKSMLVAIEPRRRAGLQPAPLEAERLQRLRQLARRRLAGAAGRVLLGADVDQAVQERAVVTTSAPARVRVAVFHRADRRRGRARRECGPALPISHSMFGSASSARLDPRAVDLLVRLRARRPDRRTAAAIEQLELNAGRVDRAAHQAAERVDLADEMPLRRAADRRVARHVRDGVARQRAEADARAEPRRRVRRLAARVAGADRRSRRSCLSCSDVICRCRTREKMCASRSSVRALVRLISSSAVARLLQDRPARILPDNATAALSDRRCARARNARIVRPRAQRDVPHVGDRAGRSRRGSTSSAARNCASRSSSRPSPVGADTNTASDRPELSRSPRQRSDRHLFDDSKIV